jgi:ABC-2 type transport system ATP-binding protein
MTISVKLQELSKRFVVNQGGFFSRTKREITAVDRISLDVEEGQSIAFIGPNGAGKSTTIKMLTGILKPTSGLVEVLGMVPWSQRSKLSRQIGAVFGQRSQLWYHLAPSDTFDLLAKIYDLSAKEYKERRDMLVEKFKLESFLSIQVRKLSLGQRMRCEIAASLLHKPRILFLDEPTIGLDVVARQELRGLIREWNQNDGLTVFLTSHDAGDIESVAERVVIVNHGRIVLDDKVATLRREYLGEKVLHTIFHERPDQNRVTELRELSGITMLEAQEYAFKLEVNVKETPIQAVISKIMQCGAVADITIEDPPLEEVIAHMYGRGPSAIGFDANPASDQKIGNN